MSVPITPKCITPRMIRAIRGLKVHSGVEAPPIVNPYFKPKRRVRPSTEVLIEGILAGSITHLSQAVTLIESRLQSDTACRLRK